MALELWQLYDPQGRPIAGRGARKHEAAVKALLHASAHIWVWRRKRRSVEVLVQKRAEYKVNWPSRLDKSAGGHILLGEEPLGAAIRKAKEEIGMTIDVEDVHLAGVSYWREVVGDTGLVDHEYQWVYVTEFNEREFILDPTEVETVIWKPIMSLGHEGVDAFSSETYVPYGPDYFVMLQHTLRRLVAPLSVPKV